MIDRQTAFSIASESLNKRQETFDRQGLVLLMDSNLESDFAWVFFYDSAKHVETGSYADALVGAGPILVDKADGTVHSFGSAFSAESVFRNMMIYESKVQGLQAKRCKNDCEMNGSRSSSNHSSTTAMLSVSKTAGGVKTGNPDGKPGTDETFTELIQDRLCRRHQETSDRKL